MPDRRGLDPARIGILLVLRAHLSRDLVGDRRQRAGSVSRIWRSSRGARTCRSSSAATASGPRAPEQSVRHRRSACSGSVGGERRELQGRDIAARRPAQSFDLSLLRVGAVEGVLVDEALARERAGECDGVFIRGGAGRRGVQQQRARIGEKALQRDVADAGGLEQAAQQDVLRDRGLARRSEQLGSRQPARPCGGGARDAVADGSAPA